MNSGTELDNGIVEYGSGSGEIAFSPGVAELPGTPPGTLTLSPAGKARLAAFLKRALDVTVSALLLLALLPIIAVVALVIVIESPGPVFYRAQRVGRGGRPLAMYKFRKMYDGAKGLKLTLGDDARFTRVGGFLAKTKLDEVPQLWNVLRGDMSLIGPRPEDPNFANQRRQEFEEILSVRPGITGLSQLAFAAESRILSKEDPTTHYLERILPQKIALDRMYVRRFGVGTDVMILFWTLVAIVLRRDVAVNRSTGALGLRRRRPTASGVLPSRSGERSRFTGSPAESQPEPVERRAA